ncbi:hypothetical protein [Lysinibacillus sp. 54212]|uniref:hypothetical protein n=1 Tax=Lysinibacillus sp. 54212 TaxID=3119829 RepID=UPI002FC760F0
MYYYRNPYSATANLYRWPFMWTAIHPSTPLSKQAMPTNLPSNNPFPPVDTHKLKASATRIQKVMEQAQLLINKISTSDPFAHNLMDAAQQSDRKTVEQLIATAGVTVHYEMKYTPDGIRILFKEKNCCSMGIVLNW